MQDDRDYMRQAPERDTEFQWSATVVLLVVTTVAFLLQKVLEHDRLKAVQEYLYLSREGILHGFLWQFVTFQFLHANLAHLVINLMGIYTVGRELEVTLGKASFFRLYFCTGAAGGVLHILCALLLPQYFKGGVIGASAGALGLLAAFAALYWNRPMHFMLLFSIPVTATGKNLLWMTLGLTLLFGLVSGANVAHVAHLGGVLAGLYYVFGLMHGAGWPSWPASRPVRRQRELVRTAKARNADWNKPEPIAEEELPPAEFISKEVDPILDKISAHGIQSLTERERKILEKARAKMKKP